MRTGELALAFAMLLLGVALPIYFNIPKPVAGVMILVALGLLVHVAVDLFHSRLPELTADCKSVLRYIADREPCQVVNVPGVPIDETRKCLARCAALGLIHSEMKTGQLYSTQIFRVIPRYRKAVERLKP